MPFNFYDTHTLLMAVQQLTPAATFLRDRYFPTNDASDIFATDDVLVEFRDGSKKLAPFVAPRKGGVTVLRAGYNMERYTPPFVAPRRVLTLDELRKRGFGEALYSQLTPEQRQQTLILRDADELGELITNREEAMAAETMLTNGCVMKHIADDVDKADEMEIRFYSEASNPATYTPTAKWDATGGKILKDLEAMIRMLTKRGLRASDLVCSPDVADTIINDAAVQKLLDNRRIEIGNVEPELLPDGAAIVARLNVLGRIISVISYDLTYPSNSVTLVTNQIIKMLCFDATEPSNGNSDRRNYGNNRYIYSNLRQWLNSPAAAGQWYTAQHSADQTPDSSHVWNGVNPYSGLAGFLNAFTANERAALLNTTITVGKSSTDGGGTETCTDKIFPLSCTEVGLSGDHVCGSKLAIFSDNNSRIATVTASCVANSNYSSNPGSGAAWYYWLRDAYAGSADSARRVDTDGSLNWDLAYYGYYGLRPACNLSSDLLISDSVDSDGCYTVIYNQAPTAPSSITVPSEVLGGENLSISWAASTDPDGNLSGYVLERKVGSGTWAQIYKGSSRSYTDAITYGWTSVQYRVKAYDAAGAESAYTTSATRTVTNNRPPVISGTDGALGSFSTAAPSYEYTVTDADGHQVDVVEMLDGVTLRSYTVTLGHTNTLTIGSEAWLKVVNGSHALKIVATDAKDASVTRTLTFTKAVTSVEFEQTLAMEADAMPTKALVNIQGNFPAGCTLQVWICNNGNDASPTWEDITQKARTGQKHYFTNQTKTAAAWGVKVKAKLLRGSATETCYIQSIGGNFA